MPFKNKKTYRIYSCFQKVSSIILPQSEYTSLSAGEWQASSGIRPVGSCLSLTSRRSLRVFGLLRGNN